MAEDFDPGDTVFNSERTNSPIRAGDIATQRTDLIADVQSRGKAPAEAITRYDVDKMRIYGATKTEALADLTTLLGDPALVAALSADLDSYGTWHT